MLTEVKSNSEYEVLTPNGWSDFSGIKKTYKQGGFIIYAETSDGQLKELGCSDNHRVKLQDGTFKYAIEVSLGDVLSQGEVVIDVLPQPDEEIAFYDLLDVSKDSEYYTNDMVSHNCAHINENVVTELWLSTSPALSTGGQAIIISTPKGTDNLFYRIWSDAQEKQNTFHTIELPWTVHPERDEAWFKRESASVRAAKGEWGIQQEFFCKFIASGETFIRTDILLELDKNVIAPVKRHPSDYEILVWEEPNPEHNYLLTADVSSGTAEDFSTFCLLNLNTGNVAADFKKKIPPQGFTPLLMEIGKQYNNAYICPEKNSYGLIVSEQLRAAKYPNLYFEKQTSLIAPYQPELNELPGWTTAVSNRADILAKLDVMLTTGKFKIHSTRFVDELKNFIWKNNKPQAKKGKNDDLVMAYAIAAILYFGIDADLEAPEKDENPPIEVSTLQAMLLGLSSKSSVLSLEKKRMVSSDEIRQAENPFRWIY